MPVCVAVYGYWSIITSVPAFRALSTIAQRHRALAPHLLADGLVVREHDGNLRAPPDLERLAHAIEQADAFLAQVRRVDAAATQPRPRASATTSSTFEYVPGR